MTKRSIHWKELCKNPNQEVSSFTLCHEKIYPSIMTDTDIVEQINLILTYKTSQCLQRDILVPTVSFGVQRWEACGGVEGSSIQIVPHHPPHHTICKLNPSAFVSPPLSPFSFAHQLFHKPDFDNLRRCCHHWTAPNTQSQLTAVLLIWNPGFFGSKHHSHPECYQIKTECQKSDQSIWKGASACMKHFCTPEV